MLKGKSTNENKKTGEEAFKADLGVFDNLIREGSLYIILGGLGGGTFSGMVTPFLELLSKHERRFVSIASYPFSFENKVRQANSVNTIKEINKYTDKLILVNPRDWDTLEVQGGLGELHNKMSLQLVEIVTSILKEHLEESIQKKHYPENLLKVIEVVRAFVYQKE